MKKFLWPYPLSFKEKFHNEKWAAQRKVVRLLFFFFYENSIRKNRTAIAINRKWREKNKFLTERELCLFRLFLLYTSPFSQTDVHGLEGLRYHLLCMHASDSTQPLKIMVYRFLFLQRYTHLLSLYAIFPPSEHYSLSLFQKKGLGRSSYSTELDLNSFPCLSHPFLC